MIAFSCFIFPAEGAEEGTKEELPVVAEGKLVKVHYILTVEGKVVDSSRERGPMEFQVGNRKVIPGFEKAFMGMKVGEKKSFQVSPEDGYGLEDPKNIQEVPSDKLPPEIKPEAGMTLYARRADGQSLPVKIIKVKKDTVVMDFNHLLAGKTLNFDVEVIEIK